MARSGWKTAGIIAGVGCLSMIVLVVGGVVIAAVMARATLRNLGDPDPRPVERRIALPAPADTTTPSAAAGANRTAPLRLTLDLREGSFTIRPGEPGSDIEVKGEYAPGLFELVEDQETDPATGVRRATVRFQSKAPAWARFFGGMFGDDSANRPELTVTLPRGTPIDLDLQTTMGRSEIDLGGLTLGEVSLSTSMGEHRIDFREPVVEGVRMLRINTSMGNVVIENLGNARADSINASGSMGNVTATLGGAWRSGATTDVNFEQRMGELTLRVPATVRLDADIQNENGQASQPADHTEPPDDPNAPTLRVRVKSSMGNARVVRY
jgi:hypothetical protein